MKRTTSAIRAPAIHVMRNSLGSFAVLVGASVILLWIGRGTQFHQFTIGLVLAAMTLGVALLLFELCWRAVLRVGAFPSKRH